VEEEAMAKTSATAAKEGMDGAAVEEEAMAKTSATAAKEGMDGAADGAVEEGAATTVMTAATKREAVQEGVR